MSGQAYRYKFRDDMALERALESLQVALLATTGLLSTKQVRLDASWMVDESIRVLVVDASTTAGIALNRIFGALLTSHPGVGTFDVRQVELFRPPAAIGLFIGAIVRM